MARRRGRGGYQQPGSPRPVGGPGKFSQRTDAPGSGQLGQGLGYGENKAINDLAASAPLQDSQAAGSGGGVTPTPTTTSRPGSIFGPTERPNEPMTAGIDFGPGAGATPTYLRDDPNQLIRALANASGHPDLLRLALRAEVER